MKRVANSIDSSNGKLRIMGMAGGNFAYGNDVIHRSMPNFQRPIFRTMPVSMRGQGGGSIYKDSNSYGGKFRG